MAKTSFHRFERLIRLINRVLELLTNAKPQGTKGRWQTPNRIIFVILETKVKTAVVSQRLNLWVKNQNRWLNLMTLHSSIEDTFLFTLKTSFSSLKLTQSCSSKNSTFCLLLLSGRYSKSPGLRRYYFGFFQLFFNIWPV